MQNTKITFHIWYRLLKYRTSLATTFVKIQMMVLTSNLPVEFEVKLSSQAIPSSTGRQEQESALVDVYSRHDLHQVALTKYQN